MTKRHSKYAQHPLYGDLARTVALRLCPPLELRLMGLHWL